MKTVTQAEFGRMQGVSGARVSQWIKNKTISLESNGRIDPDKAKGELLTNLDHAKRIDWEASYSKGGPSRHYRVEDPGDGPPPPYTGNIVRDVAITSLAIFYEYYVSIMGPIQLKLLRELCHVAKESAEDLTILFAFKSHEIIREFLERDVFDSWLKKNEGVGIDKLQGELLGKAIPKTFPPRDFSMDHPAFIVELLKSQKNRKG